ncbi:MAG: beta strand repeat-containing protein [Opitutaceae bacterium]
MKHLIYSCALLAACAFTTNVNAANRTWNGSTDTDYDTPANWSGTDVPDADDGGILTGGGTGVTLLSGGSTNTANAFNVRNGHIFNIDNDGGVFNVTNNLNLGRGVEADGSVINQLAGTVNLGGLDMSGNVTGGTSTYTISGGALNIGSADTLDVGGDGLTGNVGGGSDVATFAIVGDTATVSLTNDLVARASSVFSFALGATGIDDIDTTGNISIASGSTLNVDGASYTGGEGTITLFTYATSTDATEFTENVTNFAGLAADVVYGATSIDLVLTSTVGPGDLAILLFYADDPEINPGESTTLNWTVQNETTLTLDQTIGDVFGTTSIVVSPSTTTTYTLTAGDGGANPDVMDTVTVTVLPQITSFTADDTLVGSGDTVTLDWTVTNAPILTLNPGAIDVSGLLTYDVMPTVDTTYELVASNGSSPDVNATVDVVVAPEIISFTADDIQVGTGDSVTLSWDVENETILTINPGAIVVTGNSSVVVNPTTSTTYTLTAGDGTTDVDATVDVQVGPVINSFTASVYYVQSGDPVDIDWSVENLGSGSPSLTLTTDNGVDAPVVDDVIGDTPPNQINPTENATYTLTAGDGVNADAISSFEVVIVPANPVIPSGGRVISVNFHVGNDASSATPAQADHELTTGETAGYIPLDGSVWNNINVGDGAAHNTAGPIFASTALIDDLGAPSVATLAPSVDSTWFVGYAASAASAAEELNLPGNDDDLFNSYLALNGPNGDGTPLDAAVLNISGLGSDYTSGGYTLIVYSDSDRRGGSNVRQSLFTLTPDGGSAIEAFVEDDDAAPGINIFDNTYVFSDYVDDGADYSNFVIFEGLTAASFSLEISSADGGRGAISGFQIIGNTGLPAEPLVLNIGTNGANLDLDWNSLAGMSYNLRGNATLGTDPSTWGIVSGQGDIVATPPTNTLSITRPVDDNFFYIIEEFETP